MSSVSNATQRVAGTASAPGPAPATTPAHLPGSAQPQAGWQCRAAPGAMIVLALIGLTVAFYVSWGSYTGNRLWCIFFDGCNTVAQSPFARIFGVPLSFLGVFYYLHLAGLAVVLLADPHSRGLRAAALIYTAVGVGYSLYALYLQLSAIHALCSYCMISALTTLALFGAAVWLSRTPAEHRHDKGPAQLTERPFSALPRHLPVPRHSRGARSCLAPPHARQWLASTQRDFPAEVPQ
jgi:uncharacterized membrane protein